MELNGHEPMLEKVISNGDQLIRARHFAASDIKNKCEDLKKAWAELLGHSKFRKNKLDFSVQKQGVSIRLYSNNHVMWKRLLSDSLYCLEKLYHFFSTWLK